MATIWEFSIQGEMVKIGGRKRPRLTRHGCNEPYRDRYWCPKLRWFRKESCPFANRRECENFNAMCGCV